LNAEQLLNSPSVSSKAASGTWSFNTTARKKSRGRGEKIVRKEGKKEKKNRTKIKE